MKPISHAESDPGPTGKTSPPKVWGLIIMVGGAGPMALFYLEIGPQVDPWTAFGLTIGLVLFGAGLYYGKGKGWAQKIGKALRDRVAEG